MAEVRWTLRAVEALEAISEHIAEDSPHYARLFVIDIMAATDRLEHFPNAGRMMPDLGDPAIREIIHGNYRIIYRVKTELVEIIAVHHSARLLDSSSLE